MCFGFLKKNKKYLTLYFFSKKNKKIPPVDDLKVTKNVPGRLINFLLK